MGSGDGFQTSFRLATELKAQVEALASGTTHICICTPRSFPPRMCLGRGVIYSRDSLTSLPEYS